MPSCDFIFVANFGQSEPTPHPQHFDYVEEISGHRYTLGASGTPARCAQNSSLDNTVVAATGFEGIPPKPTVATTNLRNSTAPLVHQGHVDPQVRERGLGGDLHESLQMPENGIRSSCCL